MQGDLVWDNSEVRQALPASLAQLAAQINAEHEATEANARATIKHARDAGELLRQVKAQVGHGNWLPWIQQYCQFSERTARRYMEIADRWAELANRPRVADLTLREGLRLLAEPDEDGWTKLLPFDARLAFDGGMISESAARRLLDLQLYNRVATTRPFAEFHNPGANPNREGSHSTWANHIAKLIIWRPRRARTDEVIAYEVDSALFDLEWVEIEYARLPENEALKLAEQNMQNPDRDEHGLCSPEYWWAMLWIKMQPDYSRLSEDDLEMLDAASKRYLGIPEETIRSPEGGMLL